MNGERLQKTIQKSLEFQQSCIQLREEAWTLLKLTQSRQCRDKQEPERGGQPAQ